MDFRFDPDILDLRDGARAFLEGECPPERLRGLADGGDPLALWPRLAEMGLLGAGAAEDHGGLGLAMEDVILLCEEAGRAGLPEPFSETAAVLVPALGALAPEKLPDVISGARRGVVVHGVNPLTNHAETADFALICSEDRIILAEAGAFETQPRESIDPGRCVATVDTRGGETLLEGAAASEMSDKLAAHGAVAAAAELCGLAARMIQMATDYAQTREQFGRPIGAFQAVKHLLANAQVKLEFARPHVYRAGASLHGDTVQRNLSVAQAKIAATDAAMLAGENAIQVFGGMGYTLAVDLHFLMKRAWALAGLWGDRNAHMGCVDRLVLSGAVPIGPGETFTQDTTRSLINA